MISLSDFRVVYEGKVLNAVGIDGYDMAPESYDENGDAVNGMYRLEKINILVLDTDGTIKAVYDKGNKFQFLPKVRE